MGAGARVLVDPPAGRRAVVDGPVARAPVAQPWERPAVHDDRLATRTPDGRPPAAHGAVLRSGERDYFAGHDDVPATASAAIGRFNEVWRDWRDCWGSLSPERVWEPLGDREGVPDMKLGADDPLLNVVLHMNRETIHHGAEVALLRDLYRWREGRA